MLDNLLNNRFFCFENARKLIRVQKCQKNPMKAIPQNIWHFYTSPRQKFADIFTRNHYVCRTMDKKSRKRSSSRVKFEHIRNDYFNAYQFYALCYEIQVQINFWWRLMVSRSYKITSIFYSRLSADPPSSKPVQISFLTIMWPISHDLFRITWWCPA